MLDGRAGNKAEIGGTFARLTRAARPFALEQSAQRRFASPADGHPVAVSVMCEAWAEGSVGDPMHKLLSVVAGHVDIEGHSGGWLVLPGHLIVIPANRTFNLRTSDGAVVQVIHLDPTDSEWLHEGCWVTRATPLAHEMIRYVLSALGERPSNDPVWRHYFRTLSHLCRDWFTNARMLFVPAPHSESLRAVVEYVRDNLSSADVAGACRAGKLPQRTLHRRCLDEFGFGLRTLIREVRTMQAMERLSTGRETVQTIARSVGFVSIGSFTSAFSERFGVSPSEFMRSSRRWGDSVVA